MMVPCSIASGDPRFGHSRTYWCRGARSRCRRFGNVVAQGVEIQRYRTRPAVVRMLSRNLCHPATPYPLSQAGAHSLGRDHTHRRPKSPGAADDCCSGVSNAAAGKSCGSPPAASRISSRPVARFNPSRVETAAAIDSRLMLQNRLSTKNSATVWFLEIPHIRARGNNPLDQGNRLP